MESMDILYTFLLGFFGMIIYAVIAVRKGIKEDRKLDLRKFVGDNLKFWGSSLALHLLVSIASIVAPDILELLHKIGFAIEDSTSTGWILFGISLAAGTDNTKISGVKMLSKSN